MCLVSFYVTVNQDWLKHIILHQRSCCQGKAASPLAVCTEGFFIVWSHLGGLNFFYGAFHFHSPHVFGKKTTFSISPGRLLSAHISIIPVSRRRWNSLPAIWMRIHPAQHSFLFARVSPAALVHMHACFPPSVHLPHTHIGIHEAVLFWCICVKQQAPTAKTALCRACFNLCYLQLCLCKQHVIYSLRALLSRWKKKNMHCLFISRTQKFVYIDTYM